MNTANKSSLAIIIPCYNEALSIPIFEIELLHFIKLFGLKYPDCKLSVIVVDNNSSDSSLILLKKISLNVDCLTVESCSKKGYGAALKNGFLLATADYLSFLDLDNTYPLVSLIDLLNKLQEEDLDIVYGARIHKDSDISFVRSLGNQLYVVLLKKLFNSNLTDVCSGMRIFKSDFKKNIINLKSNDLSFSIDFSIHVLLNKWKVSEYPIPYRARIGNSKLSVIKDGIIFFLIVIKNFIYKKNIDV